MASKYWIKLYHEILHDPKMGRLPDRLWRRFVELCLIAGENDIEGILPTVEDMAWTLRLDEAELQTDVDALALAGFVDLLDEDATWTVTNFAKRQAPVSGAERTARHRDRKRQEQYYCNESLQDAETKRSTDTDTDTDTDKRSNGADAPANGPSNFEDWLALVEKPPEGSNRQAQLVHMHDTLFPGRDPPDYGYVGKTAKTVGGAGRLAALMWQASAARATGDVMRYCMGIAKRHRQDGKPEPKGYAGIRQWMEEEGDEWPNAEP